LIIMALRCHWLLCHWKNRFFLTLILWPAM
jgi:hypothetical protein